MSKLSSPSAAELAVGTARWNGVKALIDTLATTHNTPEHIRAMTLSWVDDGMIKDPVGAGVTMLADSVRELLTPMDA